MALFLSGLGIGLCFFLALYLLRYVPKSRVAVALMVMVSVALSLSVQGMVDPSYQYYFVAYQSLIAFAFWYCAVRLFNDDPIFPTMIIVLALYSFFSQLLGVIWWESTGNFEPWMYWWAKWIPQYIEFGFLLLGFYEILRGWHTDLIEGRRNYRVLVAASIGVAWAWGGVSYFYGIGTHEQRLLAADLAMMIICAKLIISREDIDWLIVPAKSPKPSMVVMEENGQTYVDVEPIVHVESKPVPAIEDTEEWKALHSAMAKGVYRKESLTLKSLASRISIPEYRLRELINQSLGYRNFNEYLNEVRTTEAASRLIHEPETPISNIALDVGYRNISSFNRIFKKYYNLTPTIYREQGLRSPENS